EGETAPHGHVLGRPRRPGDGPLRPRLGHFHSHRRRVPRGVRPAGPGRVLPARLRAGVSRSRMLLARARAPRGCPRPWRLRQQGEAETKAMAGYSGTPLVKKLGIKEGHAVGIVNAPEGFVQTLGELPRGVEVATE